MTSDHARKKAIRARMDASGEPYSVAARKFDAGPAADAQSAVADVAARVSSSLASPRAQIMFRTDWAYSLGTEYRLNPVERLAASAARAVGKLTPSRTYLGSVRERVTRAIVHPQGEGFIEPAAGRFQLVYGGAYAIMQLDGERYDGPAGVPLPDRHHRRPPEPEEPLGLMEKLRDVTDARQTGREAVRGTPCRVIAVTVGPAEFTVWIDDEHVRRIQTWSGASSPRAGSLSLMKTLELWDFGARDASVDWTRLPGFRAAGHETASGR